MCPWEFLDFGFVCSNSYECLCWSTEVVYGLDIFQLFVETLEFLLWGITLMPPDLFIIDFKQSIFILLHSVFSWNSWNRIFLLANGFIHSSCNTVQHHLKLWHTDVPSPAPGFLLQGCSLLQHTSPMKLFHCEPFSAGLEASFAAFCWPYFKCCIYCNMLCFWLVSEFLSSQSL